MEINKNIANRIKETVAHSPLKLKEIAKKAGFTTWQQIQQYTLGIKNVSIPTLEKLSRALNVPMSYLQCRDKETVLTLLIKAFTAKDYFYIAEGQPKPEMIDIIFANFKGGLVVPVTINSPIKNKTSKLDYSDTVSRYGLDKCVPLVIILQKNKISSINYLAEIKDATSLPTIADLKEVLKIYF